jgi:hypothetical protein
MNLKVTKKTPNIINIEIRKESFEAFCNAVGLYRKEFLQTLAQSEKDHRAGRVTKRKSLRELIPKSS